MRRHCCNSLCPGWIDNFLWNVRKGLAVDFLFSLCHWVLHWRINCGALPKVNDHGIKMTRPVLENHIVWRQVVMKLAFGVYVLKSLANVLHNNLPLITAEEILITRSSVNCNTWVFVDKTLVQYCRESPVFGRQKEEVIHSDLLAWKSPLLRSRFLFSVFQMKAPCH